ncbi:hypothetical protein AAZX31_09G255700 [Glycine max]
MIDAIMNGIYVLYNQPRGIVWRFAFIYISLDFLSH